MEFCRLLAPFSTKATHQMKVQAIFDVFDVDGDGNALSELSSFLCLNIRSCVKR